MGLLGCFETGRNQLIFGVLMALDTGTLEGLLGHFRGSDGSRYRDLGGSTISVEETQSPYQS